MTHSQLVTEVLALPDQKRAELALALLRSLRDAPGGEVAESQEEWSRAWAAELRRRSEELDSGRLKAIPADQVFAELREHAKRGG